MNRPIIFHAPGDEGLVRSLKLQARVPVNAKPVVHAGIRPGRPWLLRNPQKLVVQITAAIKPLTDALQKLANEMNRTVVPALRRLGKIMSTPPTKDS